MTDLSPEERQLLALKLRELERVPYPSEESFFSANPHVAGMATEDSRIVLNPAPVPGADMEAVRMNEAARLYLRAAGVPEFEETPEQTKFLDSTEYRSAGGEDRRATLLARILSGDSSAQGANEEQRRYARAIQQQMLPWLLSRSGGS